MGEEETWAQLKREVFGQAGYGIVAEEEGSLGDGVAPGGGIGILLSDRSELVIDLSRQGNKRNGGPGRFFNEGRTLILGSALLYHFSKRQLQPFLRLGVNYARMEATGGFTPWDSSPGFRFEGTQNLFGPDAGSGPRFLFANTSRSDRSFGFCICYRRRPRRSFGLSTRRVF